MGSIIGPRSHFHSRRRHFKTFAVLFAFIVLFSRTNCTKNGMIPICPCVIQVLHDTATPYPKALKRNKAGVQSAIGDPELDLCASLPRRNLAMDAFTGPRYAALVDPITSNSRWRISARRASSSILRPAWSVT